MLRASCPWSPWCLASDREVLAASLLSCLRRASRARHGTLRQPPPGRSPADPAIRLAGGGRRVRRGHVHAADAGIGRRYPLAVLPGVSGRDGGRVVWRLLAGRARYRLLCRALRGARRLADLVAGAAAPADAADRVRAGHPADLRAVRTTAACPRGRGAPRARRDPAARLAAAPAGCAAGLAHLAVRRRQHDALHVGAQPGVRPAAARTARTHRARSVRPPRRLAPDRGPASG